jgi:hypothetical protein
MPSTFTVLEIGEAHVLVRTTDEFDVERVELYERIGGRT